MDETTRAFLDAPSPLVDPRHHVDAVVSDDGAEATAESGVRFALRWSSSGPGIRRLRVGPPTVPEPSPILRPGYAEDPSAGIATALHDGAFLPGSPFPAWGRLEGDRPGWIVTCRIAPYAGVFGGGESFQGPDLRGRLRRVLNSETHALSGFDLSYIGVPFFWSDAGWGVFFHTGTPMVADLGATHGEVAAFAVEGDGLDVFVFEGTPLEILQRYLSVTGLPGRVPDWALGVWTSRCSYLTANEVDGIVAGFEAADAPLDVVHIDAWVTGNVIHDLSCNWEVDHARWPEGWIAKRALAGVRVSLWHNPYVLTGTTAGDELDAAGLLLTDAAGAPVGTNDMVERRVIDFTDDRAVKWWRDKVLSTVESEKNATFKADFGEEVPSAAVCADGRTGWQVRNEYALRYQRTTYDALSELSDDGVALFCRSGTAGSQRYPCHWVGDTPCTWEGMATALRACLSLSLSGFGFVAHDIGGFWTPRSWITCERALEEVDPSLIEADVEPLLYARWVQWGALTPVMRFHGAGRREPFAYSEPYRSVALAACRLRGRLRPYLVEAAAEAAELGLPMMRPMVLAFPDDRDGRAADLQYMLGRDLLVVPVLEPEGPTQIYVPEGRWTPLVGLDPVEGPGWMELDVPLGAYPAWTREGVAL